MCVNKNKESFKTLNSQTCLEDTELTPFWTITKECCKTQINTIKKREIIKQKWLKNSTKKGSS